MIVSTGNHYIIQVKGNQKSLLKQIEENTSDEQKSLDVHVEETNKRGRNEIRKTLVYKDLRGISPEWTALSRLIRVERSVCEKKRQRHETSFYISDIKSNKAGLFA